jgi:hypothetical protein
MGPLDGIRERLSSAVAHGGNVSRINQPDGSVVSTRNASDTGRADSRPIKPGESFDFPSFILQP